MDEYCAPGFHVYFSKMGTGTHLNGMLFAGELERILERKKYKNVDMVLHL